MKRSFIFTLAALAAFGLASTAMAEGDIKADVKSEAAGKPGKDFKKMDPKEHHEKMFKKTDTDGDGKISKDEFMKSHQERAEKAFEMLDTNKDGVLSKEELEEGRKHWKKKMRHHGDKHGGKHGDKHGKKFGGKPDEAKPPRE